MSSANRQSAGRRWTVGTTLMLLQMAVWALIDVTIVLPCSHMVGPDRYQIWTFLVVSVGAQLATLAGWLALGDGSVLGRLLMVAAGIGLTELISQFSGENARPGDPTALATGYITVLALVPFVATSFGWLCRQDGDLLQPDIKPFQFKISQVLLLTAVVAVVLGLTRIAPATNLEGTRNAGVAALIVGILPWTQWLVMLRPNYEPWLPAGLFVLFSACVAMGLATAPNGHFGIALVVVHTATLGINLFVFRAYGYRLVRSTESQHRQVR